MRSSAKGDWGVLATMTIEEMGMVLLRRVTLLWEEAPDWLLARVAMTSASRGWRRWYFDAPGMLRC